MWENMRSMAGKQEIWLENKRSSSKRGRKEGSRSGQQWSSKWKTRPIG